LSTLGTLQVGARAKVTGFTETGTAYRRKLLTMGLTPGCEIAILRVAPMGDPVEIRVRGSQLSLRKEEACSILVEELS